MTLALDVIAIMHGVFGVMILMGIGGALVSLWGDPKRNPRMLKFFSLLAAFSALIVVVFGDALYAIYRSPQNARDIIRAGDYKWAHSIGMEFKEHVGHFIPVLLLIVVFIVFYFDEDIVKNENLRRSVMVFLTASLLLTIVELVLGTLIAGIQPVI